MDLYLYLNQHSHADTWVNGGLIPINPASTYKAMERAGIFTPDENLIHNSPVDLSVPNRVFDFGLNPTIKNFNLTNVVVGGIRMPDISNGSYYTEDGLILSFSKELSGNLARKMKKKACVKIPSIDLLKEHLDAQLGIESKAGFCKYTFDHQRNHFLKSTLDMWQAEYRLFWALTKKVEVNIPAGTAELVRIW